MFLLFLLFCVFFFCDSLFLFFSSYYSWILFMCVLFFSFFSFFVLCSFYFFYFFIVCLLLFFFCSICFQHHMCGHHDSNIVMPFVSGGHMRTTHDVFVSNNISKHQGKYAMSNAQPPRPPQSTQFPNPPLIHPHIHSHGHPLTQFPRLPIRL